VNQRAAPDPRHQRAAAHARLDVPGASPTNVRPLVDALPAEQRRHAGIADATPADIWQDVIASFLALTADADAGLARWNTNGSVK
jgi:hypothetical protein